MPNVSSLLLPLLGALALSLASTACTRTSRAADGEATISIKGSDTMVILGQRWAEEYMKAVPTVTVQVTGGGSGTGIAALIHGSVDVCQSSRPMTSREKAEVLASRGQAAVETKVAIDALAVYVNEKSPVRELSLGAVSKIYRGATTSWKDVGGPDHEIILYGRDNSSGTYGYFKDHVLGGKDFAPETQSLAGTSALVSAVREDPFGIGYGGIAYTVGIRALRVRSSDASGVAVAPSRETAEDGSYPLTRSLYFCTLADPGPSTSRFMAWVTGPEGQRTISEVGYFPLPRKS